MRKAVRWGLILTGGVFGLFFVGLIVLTSVVDPNDYKERIAAVVKKTTGRTLTFGGDLDLLFFPRFGVELGSLSLSNADGFGPAPMVRVDAAKITVETLPLIMGKVRFDDLVLDGLTLDMGRDKSGKANWDDLVGRDSSERPEASDDDESYSLEINGVRVTNARLVWDDEMAGAAFTLSGISLITGEIRQGSVFPVDGRLDFTSSSPQVEGSLILAGKSSFDLENREYGHLDMDIKVAVSGEGVPGGKADMDLKFKFMALNLNKDLFQVTGLEASAYGATFHADATVEGLTRGFKKGAATVSLEPCDLKKVLGALGQSVRETADPTTLRHVGGSAEFAVQKGLITTKSLQVDLDSTRIVGNCRVEAGDPLPFVFARLDSGPLNLDRYLRPSQEASTEETEEPLLLPVDLLRALGLDIQADISELVVGKAHLQNVKAALLARDGLVELKPLGAELYSGRMSVVSTIDAAGEVPRTGVTVSIKGVDIGDLSEDVSNGDPVKGMLDSDIAVTTTGVRRSSMLGNLNGSYRLGLTDGVFPGVDLFSMAKRTHAAKGKTGKVEAASGSTAFGSIEGSGVIRQGVVSNEDLEVKAPGLRATGNGAVSLVSGEIDYMLHAKMVPTSKGQGGKDSDDLYGVLVPIHVTGTLDKPYYWVSLTEYVKALGGVVIDVTGSVLGGVKDVVTGVGSALGDAVTGDSEKQSDDKKFLGIF